MIIKESKDYRIKEIKNKFFKKGINLTSEQIEKIDNTIINAIKSTGLSFNYILENIISAY